MFPRPPLTPFVRTALITLTASLIASAVLTNFLGVPITRWLALDTTSFSPLSAWQLVSYVLVYPLVPDRLLSFAITLLFFWWIVAPFEERHGQRRVLELCVAATVLPALAAVIVGQILPQEGGMLFGTSYITLATLCADAMLLPPHAALSLFGLVTLRPRQLIYVVLGWAVVNFLIAMRAVDLAADLAAIGTGYAFARYWMLRVPKRRGPRSKRRPPAVSGRIRLVRDDDDDEKPKHWLN